MSTDRKAYYEIKATLPERQRAVLQQLEYYFSTKRRAPTAQELDSFSQIDGGWKRLSELEAKRVVHKGKARRCTITGKTAHTWELGLPKEETLF